MKPTPERRYLQKQALPASVPGLENRHWDWCLCLPAYRETPEFLPALFTRPPAGRVLLILVLNRPETDSETDWANRIRESLGTAINQRQNCSLHAIPGAWHHWPADSHCLLIDAATGGNSLPAKQGVGLARRIAADTGLQLISDGCIRHHWLFNTDADAQLDPGHFEATAGLKGGAACYPFRHAPVGDQTLDIATQIYEWRLHYWVHEMRATGCPGGWHALGSCIAVYARDYALAAGFPKRSAAEDFHLLAKVAKQSEVHCLTGPLVQLASRHSDRVPFGTGPGVSQVLEQSGAIALWHPRCFELLTEAWRRCAQRADIDSAPSVPCSSDESNWIDARLGSLGLLRQCAHIAGQFPKLEQRTDALRRIFDAFQSMKWVRAAAALYPDVSLSQLKEQRPDLPVPDALSDLDAWIAANTHFHILLSTGQTK